MRIVIGTSSLPPASGIATYVDEIARWFVAQGDDVLVVHTSLQQLDASCFPYDVYPTGVPESRHAELEAMRSLHDRLMAYDPECLMNNDNLYLSSLLPCLPASCVRISVAHGYRPGWGLDVDRLIASAAVYNHAHLDWLAPISRAMAVGLVQQYGIPQEMVRVVYNGINLPILQAEAKQAWPGCGPFRILFAGGAQRVKGADLFVRICRRLLERGLAGCEIVWAGGAAALPRPGRHLLATNNVRWLGQVSRQDLLSILQQSHLLLMPSRAEGCPMLLLEAMSQGVVPFVSDCPSAMREIVSAADCGRVLRLKDTRSWTDAVWALVEAPDQWQVWSTNAGQYYAEHLRIDQCGSHLRLLAASRREGFTPHKVPFPPHGLVPYHRRPFAYPKWDPRGICERLRVYGGGLPKPIT